MDSFTSILDFIQSVGVVGGLLTVVVLSVLIFIGYAIKRYMDHTIQNAGRMMDIEERKENDQRKQLQYLKEASTRQETLYNTTLNSVNKLADVIERVSTNLAAQNERTVEMVSHLRDIHNSMSTHESVQRIHNKMDEMQRTAPDKDDVRQILDAIADVDDRIQNVQTEMSALRLSQLNH